MGYARGVQGRSEMIQMRRLVFMNQEIGLDGFDEKVIIKSLDW